MNEFEKKKRFIEDLKQIYPPGTRIICIEMNDSQAIQSGTRGTVNHIDDEAQIHINWDNGRSLALIPTVDGFRKLTEQELAEENNAICVEESTEELIEESEMTQSM